MSKKYKYSAKEVSDLAEGQWIRILDQLDNRLQNAFKRLGGHVPCPVHGGKDGFRLDKNVDEKGGGFSNKDGGFTNGFKLLMWLKDWDFPTALEEVAKILGVQPNETARDKKGTVVKTQYFEKPFTAFGEFVECGKAPYKFNQKNNTSFYVKLKRDDWVSTIWGLDLQDMLTDVIQGDRIVLKKVGKQFVHIPDGKGGVINAHRNVWELINKTASEREANQAYVAPDYVLQAENVKINEYSDRQKRKAISRVWLQSQKLGTDSSTSAVMKYLQKRGVSSQLLFDCHDTLRGHPGLNHYDENPETSKLELTGVFPTMVASVRNKDNEVITLHRTYLTHQGDKISGVNKKIMASPEYIAGVAIRLGGIPSDGVLGITEGIENALSVTKATGLTCWSVLSTWGIKSFEVPEGVKAVIIWADKDAKDIHGNEPGLDAAKILYERLISEGIPCTIALPKIPLVGKSVDWNDVLLTGGGVQAFPDLRPVKVGLLKQAALMSKRQTA